MGSVLFLTSVAAFVLVMAYSLSAPFNLAVRRLFGARAVAIRRMSDGEFWTAVVRRDPWGELYAYRYPHTKCGLVRLNADGTGEYCGPVEWVPLGKKGNVL